MKILPIICFIAVIGCATRTAEPPDDRGRRVLIHKPAEPPESSNEEESEDDMITAFAIDIYRAQRINAMRAIGGVALVVLLLHWSRRWLDKITHGFGFTVVVVLVTSLLLGLLTLFT